MAFFGQNLPDNFARLLNSVNYIASFSIGVPLNVLLLWLTVKKTPNELRANAKIVLQNCFSDIALLTLALIVQPIPFLHKSGLLMVLENGFTAHLPRTFGILFADLWLYFTISSATLGVCIQFVFRFLILLYRKTELGPIVYSASVFVAVLMHVLLLGFMFWIGFPRVEPNFKGDDEGAVPDIQPSIVFCVDKEDPRWAVWCIFAGVVTLILCSIATVCALKLSSLLRKNVHLKTNEVRLNQQMNRSMTIQLVLALFVYSLAFILAICTIRAPYKQWLGAATAHFVGPILSWAHVLNPLVTVATIGPYRRAIRFCFIAFVRNNHQTMVTSPPQSTTAYSLAVRNLQHVNSATGTSNPNHLPTLYPIPIPNFVLPAIDVRNCRRQSVLSSTVYTVDSSVGGQPESEPEQNRRASLELPPVQDRRISRITARNRSQSSVWSQTVPLGVIRRL